MLPALELAQIRADAAVATLDQTCVIQRKMIATDNMGGDSYTWATIATVQAGLSEPSAGQLQNYDFKIGSLAAWQVKLPYGTNIQHQDQLMIGGQILIVQVVLAPRSYAALLTVLASEVK